MFRSSTSSSDSRSILRVSASATVILLVAELLLRVPAVESVIGPPDIYYSDDVVLRLEALDQVLDEYGRIDVLFVGSSVVRSNIDPTEFDRVAATLGEDVVSFNAGLSSVWPDVSRTYVDHLWLDRARPRVLVQAIRYEELVNADLSWEVGGRSDGHYEAAWRSDTLGGELRGRLLDLSVLARYSGWLTDFVADPGGTTTVLPRFETDARGYAATKVSLADWLLEVDPADIPGGGASVNGYPDAIRPDMFASGLRVISEIGRVTQARGVEFVLLNMPEHGSKFVGHEGGEERYSLYIAALRDLADREGFTFIDLTGGDATSYVNDESFADFHHMTPEGAREFSARLAGILF